MVNGSWYRRGYLPTDVGYPKIPNKIPRSRLFETMPSGSNWDVHIERSKNRCSNTGCSKIGQPFDVYKYVYIYIQIYVYIRIYIYNYIYIFLFMWFPSKQPFSHTGWSSGGRLWLRLGLCHPKRHRSDLRRHRQIRREAGNARWQGEGVSLLRGASSPKNMWANFWVMVFWKISKSY